MKIRIYGKKLLQLVTRFFPPGFWSQEREEVVASPITEWTSDDTNREIKPAVGVRSPSLWMFMREREWVVDGGDMDMRLSFVIRRIGRIWTGRNGGQIGLVSRVWPRERRISQLAHHRQLQPHRTGGRNIDQQLLVIAFTVLNHVVICTTIGIQHEIICKVPLRPLFSEDNSNPTKDHQPSQRKLSANNKLHRHDHILF